jgi:hypothetical protein
MKSGSLNLLEPSGTSRTEMGLLIYRRDLNDTFYDDVY